METKHTPGPWKHGEHDEDGQFVITNESGSAAICYGASWFGDRNDGPANARLIAAAPELLKAAIAYRNHLRTAAHTEGEVRTYEHLCEVIAKATGQQLKKA